MPEITVKSLLEAGVHFGHQVHRWNPKMRPYLFGARAGVHIIDLEQTLGYLHQAQAAAKELVGKGGVVLFVGTKRQGKDAVKAAADRVGMPYVNERWLGGFLTNWQTISERLKRYHRLMEEKAGGDWDRLPKKEVARKQDELDRLHLLLGGIRDMNGMPAVVFINDVTREDLAVKEAKKLGLPIIGVLDSNANPSGIDFPIPANDDAIGAITIVAEAIADAIEEGKADYEKHLAKLAKEADEPAQPAASGDKKEAAKA